MTEKEKLYEQLHEIYLDYDGKIKEIDDELDVIGRQNSTIVIKTINENRYYYEQWREGSSVKSKNLGKVEPGIIVDVEDRIQRRKELLLKYAELLALRDTLKKECDLIKPVDHVAYLDEYSFEVFYKNDISARVSVKKSKVHVSRFIIHPVRQLFYSDNITRHQLNEILRLRCFEEGRTDTPEKLRALGLKEYNPQMIVRKTHGVSYNDYLWFRFPGENLRAEDVLVRDEYVQKKNR